MLTFSIKTCAVASTPVSAPLGPSPAAPPPLTQDLEEAASDISLVVTPSVTSAPNGSKRSAVAAAFGLESRAAPAGSAAPLHVPVGGFSLLPPAAFAAPAFAAPVFAAPAAADFEGGAADSFSAAVSNRLSTALLATAAVAHMLPLGEVGASVAAAAAAAAAKESLVEVFGCISQESGAAAAAAGAALAAAPAGGGRTAPEGAGKPPPPRKPRMVRMFLFEPTAAAAAGFRFAGGAWHCAVEPRAAEEAFAAEESSETEAAATPSTVVPDGAALADEAPAPASSLAEEGAWRAGAGATTFARSAEHSELLLTPREAAAVAGPARPGSGLLEWSRFGPALGAPPAASAGDSSLPNLIGALTILSSVKNEQETRRVLQYWSFSLLG